MANYKYLEPLLIGEVPDSSSYYPQTNRYVKLFNDATTEELWILSNHKSGVVRYYAFVILAQRKAQNILDSLIVNLEDTTIVTENTACVVSPYDIDYLIRERLLPYLLVSMSPKEVDYRKIKSIVYDMRIPSALVTLSRFKIKSDERIVIDRLWNRQYLYYTLLAVLENPDEIYANHLLSILSDELRDINAQPSTMKRYLPYLFQAIVQYKNNYSLNGFRNAREDISKENKDLINMYIMQALQKYPDPYFDSIIKEISPDSSMLENAKHWSLRKLQY